MPQKIFFLCSMFCISCAFTLSSCNFADSNVHEIDPYGILEAQELGGQNTRLVKCSENEECPEYAQALFWMAAEILSEASAETITVEEKDFGLTEGMSIEEMTDKIGPQLENLLDHRPPKYDFRRTEFKRGLKIMERAYKAGSIYAATELGLIYMEHDTMKDLTLAKTYFEASLKRGDLISSYNLARITRMQTPDDYRRILEYLKIGTQEKNGNYSIMYMLGLEFFGTENEKKIAADYFEANKGAKFGLSKEFALHFGLIVPD